MPHQFFSCPRVPMVGDTVIISKLSQIKFEYLSSKFRKFNLVMRVRYRIGLAKYVSCFFEAGVTAAYRSTFLPFTI